MIVRNFSRVLAFAALASLLSACGAHEPIANRVVTGHYENIGSDHSLGGGYGALPGEEPAPAPRSEPPNPQQTLLEAVIKQGVPKVLADLTFENYDKHPTRIKNDDYIVMVDFSVHSRKKRFYLVNTTSGKVEPTVVAHGSGSDPDNTGYAKYFSNTVGSLMSSLGSYIIAETYVSDKFGNAIRLDGLDGTNSRVRERAVVMHGADYVTERNAKQGRSWGCPALQWDWRDRVFKILPGGSFMYVYGVPGKMSPQMLQAHLRRMSDLSNTATGGVLSESEAAPFAGE